MMVEVYQDLLPALLAMSVYMTFAGAHLMQFLVHNSATVNRQVSRDQLPLLHSRKLPERMLEDMRITRLAWFARMVGRKEGPEDDSDYFSSPIKLIQQHRGGFMWRKNLYSPVLKETPLLF